MLGLSSEPMPVAVINRRAGKQCTQHAAKVGRVDVQPVAGQLLSDIPRSTVESAGLPMRLQ